MSQKSILHDLENEEKSVQRTCCSIGIDFNVTKSAKKCPIFYGLQKHDEFSTNKPLPTNGDSVIISGIPFQEFSPSHAFPLSQRRSLDLNSDSKNVKSLWKKEWNLCRKMHY